MLWGTSLGFDGMAHFVGEPRLEQIALGPLTLGILAAIFAAALELHGVLRLPSRDPALKSAFWLLIAEVTALGLFTASLLVRLKGIGHGLGGELSMLGFLAAMLTGFARDLFGVRAAPEPEAREAERGWRDDLDLEDPPLDL